MKGKKMKIKSKSTKRKKWFQKFAAVILAVSIIVMCNDINDWTTAVILLPIAIFTFFTSANVFTGEAKRK